MLVNQRRSRIFSNPFQLIDFNHIGRRFCAHGISGSFLQWFLQKLTQKT